jgi:predicted RNA binding protein YcfA (HicA-like mRNA interferase family)
MEGIPALRELIETNEFICKIDLKDAYIVVPIHPESRKFLSFQHQDTIYQYRSLAFGLSVAPRVFSKLMRFALEPLRAKGIRLAYYLDDICLLTRTKEEMKRNSREVLHQLTSLGFIVNHQKGNLETKHVQEFLGFTFNSKQMQISVPQKKMSKLMSRIKQLFKNPEMTYSCRWMASLLGKITAMIPAIGEALLRIRFLQRDLAMNLRRQQYNWEQPCPLSAQS